MVPLMQQESVFDRYVDRYDAWFEKHRAAYVSELLALRAFVPYVGDGLEIGVGTGRFAAPLGIQTGVEPSRPMLAMAARRGVRAVEGVAEHLPFPDASFDFAMVVTTLCFVDSPPRMLAEARRVLKPGGKLVIGFIDRDSALGRHYLEHKDESVFYRDATFYSAQEVDALLQNAGYSDIAWAQTLERFPVATREPEPLHEGRGKGAFVVASAVR